MDITRTKIADLVLERLAAQRGLEAQYAESPIRHFVVDDLLPEAMARTIYAAFPPPAGMMLRRSIRELKYVTSQMNRTAPVVEEAVFAFQDPRVVRAVAEVTRLRRLEPDAELYAGGISMMGKGHFLNPHVDNSHDNDRNRYRVLNLLYYVSPDWSPDDGGNFEMWPNGTQAEPVTVVSRFNRLLVMETNRTSWHSVSKVAVDRPRCCVSNYYFSPDPPGSADYFHVTSFRGRPEQRARDLLLRADAAVRMVIRKVASRGLVRTKHIYKKEKSR